MRSVTIDTGNGIIGISIIIDPPISVLCLCVAGTGRDGEAGICREAGGCSIKWHTVGSRSTGFAVGLMGGQVGAIGYDIGT